MLMAVVALLALAVCWLIYNQLPGYEPANTQQLVAQGLVMFAAVISLCSWLWHCVVLSKMYGHVRQLIYVTRPAKKQLMVFSAYGRYELAADLQLMPEGLRACIEEEFERFDGKGWPRGMVKPKQTAKVELHVVHKDR